MFKMEAESVEFICTAPDVRAAAQEAVEKLLPAKSKPAYQRVYAIVSF
jgi:hypothetical protein